MTVPRYNWEQSLDAGDRFLAWMGFLSPPPEVVEEEWAMDFALWTPGSDFPSWDPWGGG